MVQVRGPDATSNSGLLQFADGTELTVTAHVTKEGTPQQDGSRGIQQKLEVETEQISKGAQQFGVNSGLRLNVYEASPQAMKDRAGSG